MAAAASYSHCHAQTWDGEQSAKLKRILCSWGKDRASSTSRQPDAPNAQSALTSDVPKGCGGICRFTHGGEREEGGGGRQQEPIIQITFKVYTCIFMPLEKVRIQGELQ